MSRIRHFVFFLFFLLITLNGFSQGAQSGIGETMRSSGRIYVVLAVMLVILTGLVLYLVRLDRRITRLEKE